MRIAVSLVPGVRQVLIRDGWGGLDLQQSIFCNFNFIERVFSSERDLGSPYYFSVLVAPTPSAICDGPHGLAAAVSSTLEDLRPIGIFPRVEQATQVGIAVKASLVVRGIPLPSGTHDFINASPSAQALFARLVVRLRKYVDSLQMGEPVRHSEVIWAFMNEPGVTDVRDLSILRYPPTLGNLDFSTVPPEVPEQLRCGENVRVARQPNRRYRRAAVLAIDNMTVFDPDQLGSVVSQSLCECGWPVAQRGHRKRLAVRRYGIGHRRVGGPRAACRRGRQLAVAQDVVFTAALAYHSPASFGSARFVAYTEQARRFRSINRASIRRHAPRHPFH